MDISEAGLNLIREREGCILHWYRDSRGIWTCCVGHTSAAGPPFYKEGITFTEAEADEILRRDLRQYVEAVDRAVLVKCTQNQFDAMVSFCFNVGVNGFAGSSVVRDLNDGEIRAAAQAFLLWDHPKELLARRMAERKQFLTPDTVPA